MVQWTDAWFETDYSDPPRGDYPVRTVGWVVHNENGWLSIASEELPSQDGWRAATHIPVPLVKDWKELE